MLPYATFRRRSRLRLPSAVRLRLPGSPPTEGGRLRFVAIQDGPVVQGFTQSQPRSGSVAGDALLGKLRNPCIDYLDYMLANHPGQRFRTAKDIEEWRLTYESPEADTARECLAEFMDQRRIDRVNARGR